MGGGQRLRTGVQLGDQLGDAAGDLLVVQADSRGAVLAQPRVELRKEARPRPGRRQPGLRRPGRRRPGLTGRRLTGPRQRVAQQYQVQVARAVQAGELGDHESGQPRQPQARAGEADDADLPQRDRDRHGRCRRVLRRLGQVLVGHGDRRRQVGRADPQRQRVVVAGPPFPQPGARPERGEQQRRGVDGALPPQRHLAVHRVGELPVEVRLVDQVFGMVLPILLPTGQLVADGVADHQQRRQQHEQREADLVGDQDHRDADRQRQQGGEDRNPHPVAALRLGGLGQRDRRDRRVQARRPVQIQVPEAVGAHGGRRFCRYDQHQAGLADLQHRAWAQRHRLSGDRGTVDTGAVGRPEVGDGDLLRRAYDQCVQPRDVRVVQAHLGLRAPTEAGLARTERVHPAGVRAAGHPQLEQPGRRLSRRPGPADRDQHPVDQWRHPENAVRGELLLTGVQPASGPRRAAQGVGDGRERRSVRRVDEQVDRFASARRRVDRQPQLHGAGRPLVSRVPRHRAPRPAAAQPRSGRARQRPCPAAALPAAARSRTRDPAPSSHPQRTCTGVVHSRR